MTAAPHLDVYGFLDGFAGDIATKVKVIRELLQHANTDHMSEHDRQVAIIALRVLEKERNTEAQKAS